MVCIAELFCELHSGAGSASCNLGKHSGTLGNLSGMYDRAQCVGTAGSDLCKNKCVEREDGL